MASDASQEIRGFTRRALLRNGLLVGLGTATVVAASATFAGNAWADDIPASADAPDTPAAEQFKWAWCNQCSGMFYTGYSLGECPAQGDLSNHASTTDYTSSNYGFYYNAVATSVWQGNWYWCSSCQGMFWGGRSAGACPSHFGNAPHDGTGKYPYVAYLGTNSAEGQGGWRWCKNCSGMFWGGSSTRGGLCPKNGSQYTHDGTSSSNYYIGHSGYLSLGPPILT